MHAKRKLAGAKNNFAVLLPNGQMPSFDVVNCVYSWLCSSVVFIVDFEQVFVHKCKPAKVLQPNSEL